MPTDNSKISNPLYAAAGAGDLAMEGLRKLPNRVAVIQERVNALQDELPGRFSTLQDKVTQKVAEIPSFVAELRQKMVDTDTDRLRDMARHNANVVMTNAQAASDRAVSIYSDLVIRGARVVNRSDTASSFMRIVAEVIPGDGGAQPKGVAHKPGMKSHESGSAEIKAADIRAAETKPAAKPAEPRPTDAHTPNGKPTDAHTMNGKASSMGVTDPATIDEMFSSDPSAKSDAAKRSAKVRKNN